MNIREFSNAVGLIALNYPTVQEYSEGDIYNFLNTGEHKYPCVFLTIESVEEGELNSQTLTGSLFYVDRLLNDSSNRLMVQTAAISTLKILTGKINDNISGEMVVVSYQPFTEKFADWCAGAFCEFSFTYITGSDCGEYDELALNVKENGIYDILGYEKIVVSVPQEGVSAQWVRDYTYSKKETDDKLAQKADKTEIPSLTGYATELWVQNQGYLTEHQSLDGYATETWVDGKLTGYAKKTDIPSLDGYATETWVDGRLNNKADKNEIPSLDGYATELWVQNQGYLTEHQSLEGYATQTWVQNQGYLTEHQPLKTINGQSIVGEGNIEIESGVTIEQVDAEIDSKLTGYATKEELNSKADASALIPIEGRIGALTQIVQNKADKSEIPSLDGYATELWVQNQGYLTEHQSLADYATKDELAQKADKTEIPSLTGYATELWVQNQGYLTEHQDISGKVDKSSIWTGTEAEWNALTQEQKASYTIALVR